MILKKIRIVLVQTSHPGNIGSTARAMKTMGLDSLYLVGPKSFPDYRAHEMAAGAEDVLLKAVVTDSLADALKGAQLIMALSARQRNIALTELSAAESAQLIATAADTTEVALVFGRENSGLNNQELLCCNYQVIIPSNPEYSSLNLSQAVQIICYELRLKLLNSHTLTKRCDRLASIDEVEQFYAHLKELMVTIDFLKLKNPKRLLERIRRLFNRVQLENMEVNILRGILSQVEKTIASLKATMDL